MTITLDFLGAARAVTGSKHLLSVNGTKVLLDCGMVQGPRKIANKLNAELPPQLRDVDAVVLSHAHIDHSGSLPRLVKKGYRGAIHCTPATGDLLSILLPDSAHLQESDAKYLSKRGHAFEPAYDAADVQRTLKQLQPTNYHERVEVCPGVHATFLDAGHILGSAQVLLEVRDGNRTLRLVFTGDLGRPDLPILRDPDPLPECEVLITESTYGDRNHPPREDLQARLGEVVREHQERGGRLLIPAFSVGRTQNILWYLGNLIHAGELEPLPIWIDSPLSTKATRIVAQHRELYDEATRTALAAGRNPFFFDDVCTIDSVEESKALNQERSGIIISASGMCEGGRILHHLEQTLGRPEDCVLIVGYQAQSTLGRRLLEGYETVKIYGNRHRVRCEVRHINGLSAHAGADELLAHLSPRAETLRRTFVVHGEESGAIRFADTLVDQGFRNVSVPLYKDSVEL